MQSFLNKAKPFKKTNLTKSFFVESHKDQFCSTQSNKQSGFTLVEIMVTIAVLSIIITVALPSLGTFLTQMRVDNKIVEVQRLLLTTRNAAINSGQNATLCPLNAAGDTCEGSNWAGRIGILSSDGLIKEREAIQTGDKLLFDFDSVTYTPSGQLSNANIGLFRYCPQNDDYFSRGVDLSLAGRAYLTTDINGDGRDQDRSQSNITCS